MPADRAKNQLVRLQPEPVGLCFIREQLERVKVDFDSVISEIKTEEKIRQMNPLDEFINYYPITA